MALTGTSSRFIYSGATTANTAQGDPTLSLGGFAGTGTSASEPYRQATLDGPSPDLVTVDDTQIDDGGGGVDPEVGDWLWVLTGAAAGSYGRITAVDYVGNTATIDRPMSALPDSPDRVRTSKAGSVFANVTDIDDINSGFQDYRMLYFRKTNAGSENNFRFYVVPIQSGGCDIELMASGTATAATIAEEPTIADDRTSPFGIYGRVVGIGSSNTSWGGAEALEIRYNQASAVPVNGSGTVDDEDCIPIWLRRTVPAGAAAGNCAFALLYYVDDATTQDASADPDPFIGGFIMHWNISEPNYNLTLTQDRFVYLDGGVKMTGTVTDDNGNPVPGLNCYMELQSGPGTLTSDTSGRTDANGQVTAIYSSPSSLSSDPVIRLVLPTNSEI